MSRYLLLFIAIITLSQCTLLDNEQPNPAYLVINEVDVITREDEGAPTHKISDVWVSVNGQSLGVFELPCRIPIIVDDSSSDITVSPGFRNNGETSRSFIYQLMEAQSFTVDLAAGDIIERRFDFRYKENIIFDFVEDFEGTAHIFTLDIDEDEETVVRKTSEDSKSGSHSGKIALTEANPLIQSATIFSYDGVQNAGSDSYLELDYKNDIPFFIGVIYVQNGQVFSQPLIVLNPKSEWNKTYIDFTLILTSPEIQSYRVFIGSDLGPLEEKSGNIYVDNLKFIHF